MPGMPGRLLGVLHCSLSILVLFLGSSAAGRGDPHNVRTSLVPCMTRLGGQIVGSGGEVPSEEWWGW